MDKVDKYLKESNSNKDEFYKWARERNGQTLNATIVEGGMVLATCKGKFQMAKGPIPDWRVNGKSGDISFPYSAFKATSAKIIGKEGWILSVMKGNLTYEIY